MKRQPIEWEKILANDVTDNGFISTMYKHLMQLSIKTTTTKKKNKQLNQKMGQRPK